MLGRPQRPARWPAGKGVHAMRVEYAKEFPEGMRTMAGLDLPESGDA